MSRIFSIACALALASAPLHVSRADDHRHTAEERAAAHAETEPVAPDRVLIDINGLVCSFCAHGIERSLSKLEALDTTQFGGDGVLVDIDAHRVTLALKPGARLPLEEVRRRIENAGYEPVRFHLPAGMSPGAPGDGDAAR